MKRISALVLVLAFGMAAIPAQARRTTVQGDTRQSRKAAKGRQKSAKAASRKQRKEMKKYAKAEREKQKLARGER